MFVDAPERLKTYGEAYREWLQTPEWDAIVGKARELHGNVCAACGKPRVQFHHLFYPANFRRTRPEHLIPLCPSHHGKAHQLSNGGSINDEYKIDWWRFEIVNRLKRYTRPEYFTGEDDDNDPITYGYGMYDHHSVEKAFEAIEGEVEQQLADGDISKDQAEAISVALKLAYSILK